MARLFRAIRIQSRSQFDQLMDQIAREIARAEDHWDFWLAMEDASDDYAVEFGQTPTFWGLTGLAHQEAVVQILARLYDHRRAAKSLGNLLQTMKENTSTIGTVFPASIATLNAGELDADIASLAQVVDLADLLKMASGLMYKYQLLLGHSTIARTRFSSGELHKLLSLVRVGQKVTPSP